MITPGDRPESSNEQSYSGALSIFCPLLKVLVSCSFRADRSADGQQCPHNNSPVVTSQHASLMLHRPLEGAILQRPGTALWRWVPSGAISSREQLSPPACPRPLQWIPSLRSFFPPLSLFHSHLSHALDFPAFQPKCLHSALGTLLPPCLRTSRAVNI